MWYWVLLLTAAAAMGQAKTEVYTFDANGRRELASQQVNGEQRIRNMNGRVAPLEKVEEKVLREDSTGREVERVVRPFDASGNPQPPQKIRIVERKEPDGSKSIETQVFNGNINGSFTLAERRQAVERSSGTQTVTETQIARPTINGSLETTERHQTTVNKSGEKTSEDTLIYRRDNNGSFYTAVREVKETEKRDGVTLENASTYITGDRRELVLTAQTVTETARRADGSETKQVNIYGINAPGRPAEGRPVLREQQIIEKAKTAAGTVETLSIRRPPVDNPNRLGPAQKISESVCTGPCK
jgi:hypothetical protein